MTSAEMFQEFQVLVDTIDSQDIPEIYPEQFFIFANLAVDELVQAGRIEYEKNSKIRDDISSLVRRVFIIPEIVEDRVKFSYNKALLSLVTGSPTLSVYYLLNGVFRAHSGEGEKKRNGISNFKSVQQDDITVVLQDPFNKPVYFDSIPIVVEERALYATPPANLKLDSLVATCIIEPRLISFTQDCDLPKPIHHSIVKRAVEIALENVESLRQKTFNQ